MSALEFSEVQMDERHRAAVLFGASVAPDSWTVIVLVSRALRVSVDEILGSDRHKSLCYARHVAMFVARAVTSESFPEIGRAFGGRDHTTVMAACEKISDLMQMHHGTALLVARLKREALS